MPLAVPHSHAIAAESGEHASREGIDGTGVAGDLDRHRRNHQADRQTHGNPLNAMHGDYQYVSDAFVSQTTRQFYGVFTFRVTLYCTPICQERMPMARSPMLVLSLTVAEQSSLSQVAAQPKAPVRWSKNQARTGPWI